jgi:hypothetical protein
VNVAIICREEAPSLNMGHSGKEFPFTLQLVCFGINASTLIVRLGEVPVTFRCGSGSSHDNVLETHGRAHVRWEA